jgi:hypothetical protein
MPDERLAMEAQGNSPHSLVAVLELSEREQMRNASHNAASPMTTNTVADRLIERAMSGIGSIPQQLSPEQEMFARQAMMEMTPEQMMQQQMMMQNPMPQPMADGGLVGYQDGGGVDYPYIDPMAELGIGGLPDEIPPYGPYGASWGRTAADIATAAMLFAPPALKRLGGLASTVSRRGFPRLLRRKTRRVRGPAVAAGGLGSLFIGRGSDPLTPDLPEDHPVFQYYGRYEDGDGGHMHSVPSLTQSDLDAALAMSGEEGEEGDGIASLIASMQAPVFGREAMDVSEYYEMTPEERRLLEFYGSGAQSLESRIDTESDRLSAQANILSNVARAMARGQVPTVGEPLRELQTAQRGRREGIMDESRAMEMAALAQEAGLSRAEQEALMERAMVEDERGYQEALRQNEIQRFEQYARMSQSENPKVQEMGVLGLQSMGVTNRGGVTGNQRAELDAKALEYYNPEFIQSVMTDVETDEQFARAVERVTSMLNLHYSSVGGAPPILINDIVDAMVQEYKRE